MPELPEVETIRRELSRLILHEKLEKTEILCEKSFIGEPVTGEVLKLRRRGKALIFDLTGGKSLLIHLRMTGQLIFDSDTAPRFAAGHPNENFVASLPNKQTRVILHFSSGVLYFNDQRKFGFIKVILTADVEAEPFIFGLGPEPWEIDAREFYVRISRRKNSAIKGVLLDQSVVSGLGNIYADEALFLAKIHPERRAGELTEAEAGRILMAAKTVMEKSIELGGSTMRNYLKPDGSRGNYLDAFSDVYGREGKKCHVCGAEIRKIRVAGRGTHFCPICQLWEAGEKANEAPLKAPLTSVKMEKGKHD